MKIAYPSLEFDAAVADACHGTISEIQARALNELLRADPGARDEYILRTELHARLLSEPDLFTGSLVETTWEPQPGSSGVSFEREPAKGPRAYREMIWVAPLAAGVALLLAVGWWWMRPRGRQGAPSHAVAMLNQAAEAHWAPASETPRLGTPLEPGWLHLKSGLAQVVFYSGARMVIEGPADLQLINSSEAFCLGGRLILEVPWQARGFRVRSPRLDVTDLGTAFGLDLNDKQSEVHVFKGSVEFQTEKASIPENLRAGAGAVMGDTGSARLVEANPAGFASLFALQAKSAAADALRYERWRKVSSRMNDDASLLAHFDFERTPGAEWQLHNASHRREAASDAAVAGCQWGEGRWPAKPALEFRNASDRARLAVPGAFNAVSLSAWVRVQGLDRRFNSLFMCDGVAPGTIHWLIRNDGVLGASIFGRGPGQYQIAATPPVLALDQLGLWVHLALVVDGKGRRLVQYLNGRPVAETPLKIDPPFNLGAAELGNWEARGFPGRDADLIRNFSGAMDDFCIFGRALSAHEVEALYEAGRQQPETMASR